MEYILMNTDTPVLEFDDEFLEIKVLDNQYLPFALKDFIKSTAKAPNTEKIKTDISALRSFLSYRVMDVSRWNSDAVFSSVGIPRPSDVEARIKIALSCRILNVEDNFWTMRYGESTRFKDVCLRNKDVSPNVFDVSIFGKTVKGSIKEYAPALMLGGMFPKSWVSTEDGEIELWKTDRFGGFNSECEVEASSYAVAAGVSCVRYELKERNGLKFAVCKNFANDNYSLAKACEIRDWCEHVGRDFTVMAAMSPGFADMVITDYIVGNTDRHQENWGFLIDNTKNDIAGLAPLYDFNQALVIDRMGKSKTLDNLIYEPTGLTFLESAQKYMDRTECDYGKVTLPGHALMRYKNVSGRK